MPFTRRKFLALSGASLGLNMLPFPAISHSLGDLQNGSLVWPPDQALPTFPKPYYLDAADLSSLSDDQQALLVTLQGIVNRRRPRLYFYWGPDTTNQTWLPDLNVPYQNNSDPWSLIERYRSEIRRAVIYDPNLPDTVNLATNLASLKGGVIATAELAANLNLRTLDDLRGRFSNKLDAYYWALGNLWPKMTKRMLTAISPTNTVSTPNVQWTTLLRETNQVRDASNRAVYTADLSPFLGVEAVYLRYQDAFPDDGWGPSVSQVTVIADGNVIASFQPASCRGESVSLRTEQLADHIGLAVCRREYLFHLQVCASGRNQATNAADGDVEPVFSDGDEYGSQHASGKPALPRLYCCGECSSLLAGPRECGRGRAVYGDSGDDATGFALSRMVSAGAMR